MLTAVPFRTPGSALNSEETSTQEPQPKPKVPTTTSATILNENNIDELLTDIDNTTNELELEKMEEDELLEENEDEDMSDTGLQNLTQVTPPNQQNRRMDTKRTETFNNNDNDNDNNKEDNGNTDTNDNYNLTNTNTDKNEENNENTDANENYNLTDRNTDKDNNPLNATDASKLISEIPVGLHASFKSLNALKHKRNKTRNTIEGLTNHQTNNTIPNGLRSITDCNILLDEDLRQQWMDICTNASKQQLNILIQQHKRKLDSLEQMIQHTTKRIQKDTNSNITDKIIQTTDHISNNYTKREFMKTTIHRNDKPNLKRLNKKRNNHRVSKTYTRHTKPTTQHDATTEEQKPTPTSIPTVTTRTFTRLSTKTTDQQLNTTRPTSTTVLSDPITADIQRQINFITATHIQTYLQQTRRQTKRK